MTDQASQNRTIPWGAIVVIVLGASVLALGVVQYVHRGGFGWRDAVFCALDLAVAWIYLLVTSYVLQHARLVAIIPVVAGLMFSFAYPPFAVALGLSLIGAIVVPMLTDRGQPG